MQKFGCPVESLSHGLPSQVVPFHRPPPCDPHLPLPQAPVINPANCYRSGIAAPYFLSGAPSHHLYPQHVQVPVAPLLYSPSQAWSQCPRIPAENTSQPGNINHHKAFRDQPATNTDSPEGQSYNISGTGSLERKVNGVDGSRSYALGESSVPYCPVSFISGSNSWSVCPGSFSGPSTLSINPNLQDVTVAVASRFNCKQDPYKENISHSALNPACPEFKPACFLQSTPPTSCKKDCPEFKPSCFLQTTPSAICKADCAEFNPGCLLQSAVSAICKKDSIATLQNVKDIEARSKCVGTSSQLHHAEAQTMLTAVSFDDRFCLGCGRRRNNYHLSEQPAFSGMEISDDTKSKPILGKTKDEIKKNFPESLKMQVSTDGPDGDKCSLNDDEVQEKQKMMAEFLMHHCLYRQSINAEDICGINTSSTENDETNKESASIGEILTVNDFHGNIPSGALQDSDVRKKWLVSDKLGPRLKCSDVKLSSSSFINQKLDQSWMSSRTVRDTDICLSNNASSATSLENLASLPVSESVNSASVGLKTQGKIVGGRKLPPPLDLRPSKQGNKSLTVLKVTSPKSNECVNSEPRRPHLSTNLKLLTNDRPPVQAVSHVTDHVARQHNTSALSLRGSFVSKPSVDQSSLTWTNGYNSLYADSTDFYHVPKAKKILTPLQRRWLKNHITSLVTRDEIKTALVPPCSTTTARSAEPGWTKELDTIDDYAKPEIPYFVCHSSDNITPFCKQKSISSADSDFDSPISGLIPKQGDHKDDLYLQMTSNSAAATQDLMQIRKCPGLKTEKLSASDSSSEILVSEMVEKNQPEIINSDSACLMEDLHPQNTDVSDFCGQIRNSLACGGHALPGSLSDTDRTWTDEPDSGDIKVDAADLGGVLLAECSLHHVCSPDTDISQEGMSEMDRLEDKNTHVDGQENRIPVLDKDHMDQLQQADNRTECDVTGTVTETNCCGQEKTDVAEEICMNRCGQEKSHIITEESYTRMYDQEGEDKLNDDLLDDLEAIARQNMPGNLIDENCKVQ